MMKIKNASQFAKRYFGLHFSPGVAQYQEADKAYNILINQDTINKMDPSFSAKPLFVNHEMKEVTPKDIDHADGFIVKSFFNQVDGKQWCEFLVVTDEGHDAIAKGYQLSNAYFVKNSTHGGEWHAVPYAKEVIEAEYEHMALVPNPRYKESIVLTPEEFKRYNETKQIELKRLTNSKESKIMSIFNFFQKSKVENADLDTMSVILPKSKAEVSLSKLINDADMEMEHKEKKIADCTHMVNVDGKEMSVGDLVKSHGEMKNKLDNAEKVSKEAADKGEADGGKEMSEKEHGEAKDEKEMKNVEADKKVETKDTAKDEKTVEAKKLDSEDKKMNSTHFNKLASAEKAASSKDLSEIRRNGVELGKQLFGSK